MQPPPIRAGTRSSSVHLVTMSIRPMSLPPMLTVTSAVPGDRALNWAGLVPSPVGCAAVMSGMVALLQLMSVRSSRRLRATRNG